MSRNVIETVMGAVVLVIAAVFLFFAYSTSQVRAVSGYELTAKFDRIEGIREGGDVRISGIKVGSIVSQTLDPTNFLAIVKVSIDPAIKLPSDSVAEILSSGLLGDKFLALVPGAADDTIKPGGVIKFTQSPMSLENLIGQYIFSQGQQKKGDGEGQGQPGQGKPSAGPAGAGLPSLTQPDGEQQQKSDGEGEKPKQ
jgi:phospholipid/cholesterol/gamma-HCH transport system substrate-binding protein